MAKDEEELTALRQRKTSLISENKQTLHTPLPEDQSDRLENEDDKQSSNGTSCWTERSITPPDAQPPNTLLVLLVLGLSVSTRFYKLAEPPHIW